MKSLQKFLFEQRGDIMSDDAVYYKISMHKYESKYENHPITNKKPNYFLK